MNLSRKQRLIAAIVMSVAFLLFAKVGPSPYSTMVGWALAALLISKLLRAAPLAFTRSVTELRRGAPWYKAAKNFLSPSVRRLLRIEIRTYQEGLCAIVGYPRPSGACMGNRSSDYSFSLHKGALSTTFVPLVIIGAIVELPLIHLAIHVWSREPVLWHVVLATLTCFGLVWAIGDRSAVKAFSHTLSADLLSIKVGYRGRCAIKLSAISFVDIIKVPVQTWAVKHGVKEIETLSLTPMDQPNLYLKLKPRKYETEYVRFGFKALAPEHVFIYVDDPQLLKRRLIEAL